jgi:2-polyprenyl-3-methyl-5-hydroxy-6-metoxy-1,4-benzoquinol methylase/tetratricopeptide (TPR) repeat protein
MNRKQRRALRHRAADSPFGSAANAAPTETIAKLYDAAVARHRAGALSEAERCYRDIIGRFPAHAETHTMLGTVLMARGKIDEAIRHFEYVAALKPDQCGAYEDLSRACLAAGRLKAAIATASRALALGESAQTRALFGQCVREALFTADDGRIRKLMLRALSEGWARPRDLSVACISLIKLDPVVNDWVARANSTWPARLPAAELLSSLLAGMARDQLLGRLLELTPITHLGFERLLTNVRLAMLTTAVADDARDEGTLGFYCAVAQQCFINQYVFSITGDEADQAQRMREALEQALAAGGRCSEFQLAIVGAYFPLHALSNADMLLGGSWPQCVRALLVQQIEEPAEERRLAATIPVLTSVEGAVSGTVRQQYEENPYPRWVRAAPPGEPIVLKDRPPDQAFDVLLAGCGTGQSTVEFARQTPRARVLAIDLSIASLCYAQRMARRYGLTNVEFAQADITRLAAVERQFDYVDACGVLHHLADPWAGWRTLLSLLRPGGVMFVGLYSQLARRAIVEARSLIAERGYRPIPEDIRRCREEIMAAGGGSVLKSVIQWKDFFAVSECRDLLFHVHEQQPTLREIKTFLGANRVRFSGFMLDAPTFQRFATRFPEPAAMTDLDCWHDFENQAPGTFAAMYQFWVQKPA